MELIRKTTSFLARFAREKRGNVAIIFGIMVLPMTVLVGGLVDYGQAIKTKSQVSAALDSAMLAAMLQYANDDSVDYAGIITDYIENNLQGDESKLRGAVLDIEQPTISDNGEMTGTVNVVIPAHFLKLVSFESFDFTVRSSVMVGGSSLELALVLDNTGSMDGAAKIGKLKSSAKDLVRQLMPNDNNPKVKIGIVPFADYVHIGKNNRDEPGLDIPDDYEYRKPGTHKVTYCPKPKKNRVCKKKKKWGTCNNDGVPYACFWWKTVCKCKVKKKSKWVKYKKNPFYWDGCMGSRNPGDPLPSSPGDNAEGLNVVDSGYDETGVPGLMTGSKNNCWGITPLTRLTSNKQDILDGLDHMKTNRQTYIPAGLAWGWRILSHGIPFTDGVAASNEATKKVVVLMTDGANTRSARHWKRSWDWAAAKNHDGELWAHDKEDEEAKIEADNYTRALCQNMKANNLVVYTIGFDLDNDEETKSMLQQCAGNGGRFFDADDSQDLSDAFRHIGIALLNLRLSR